MNIVNKKLPLGLRLLRVVMIISVVIISLGIVGIISSIILSSLSAERLGVPLSLPYIDLLYYIFGLIYGIIFILCINRPRYGLYKVLSGLIILDIIASISFLFIGYQDFVINILGITISAIDFWYLWKIKTYFITGSIDKDDPKIKKIDKGFVIVYVILLTLLILIPNVIALNKSATIISNSFTYLKEFKGKTGQQAIDYCNGFSSEKKDQCLIYVVTLSSGDKENTVLKDTHTIGVNTCQMISNESSRVACHAIINRCDVETDNKMQNLCKVYADKFLEDVNKIDSKK